MIFDDEYGEEYDEPLEDEDSEQPDSGFDPLDIKDPQSAYLFLSDDAQDEIDGKDKTKMKCLSCGCEFVGEINDCCPDCLSADIEETF